MISRVRIVSHGRRAVWMVEGLAVSYMFGQRRQHDRLLCVFHDARSYSAVVVVVVSMTDCCVFFMTLGLTALLLRLLLLLLLLLLSSCVVSLASSITVCI